MITQIYGFSEPFSSISHLLSAAGFFVGAFFLVHRGREKNTKVVSLLIYSICLVFLFLMSGLYHLSEKGFTNNKILQILDYTGIYALIAGSFTPIHMILFQGKERWITLVLVWVLAITELTLTAVFFDLIPGWLHLTFFLTLGWMGLSTFWHLHRRHFRHLLFDLTLGGVFYTIGALIEFMKKGILIPGVIESHEVFHVFVIVGAAAHWKLIWNIAEIQDHIMR